MVEKCLKTQPLTQFKSAKVYLTQITLTEADNG